MSDARFSIPFAVTMLGISHVITQVTVIREFINVFTGNEIVIGILLALWLLLSGLGAWIGKAFRTTSSQMLVFRASLFLAAFLPILHIIAIRSLRDILFVRGELPGVGPLIIWAAILLLPYCVITGGLLTIACSITPVKGLQSRSIGEVYYFDNIGDIAGGLLFTFVLVHFFQNLGILYVPALLCLAAFALLPPVRPGSRAGAAMGLAGMVLVVVFFLLSLDRLSIQWLYPEQRIIDYAESPYGRLVVTKNRDQVSFFENGEHLFSTPNILDAEELVHFALPQLERVRSVLLISGGMGGTIEEIMKYDPQQIDYVELDPAVIKAGMAYLDRDFPPSVKIHPGDGRKFIEDSRRTYDALIMDLPDPVSLQINRFYTVDFFRTARSIIRPGGIVCFAVTGAENYISPEQADLLSTLCNSLERVFEFVLIIPGERNIFIAADRPLSAGVGPLLAARNIETVFINDNYLQGRVTPERTAFLRESLHEEAPVNHDFRPAAYLSAIRVWLSRFQEDYRYPIIAVSIFMLIYFITIDLIGKTIFFSGLTASSMEVIILLTFQIVQGSLYRAIGLIIAAFMAGLAVGSYTANRAPAAGRRALVTIELAAVLYLVLFATLPAGLSFLPGPFTLTLFAFVAGALTGAEFPIAGRITYSTPPVTAGSLYAADLFGGSCGAFATTLFLIPLWGVMNTCLFLAGCKILIVAALLATMRGRR
ncbi:MAG: fused MFS/spermidine synthase [Deltaproteobacteria bacterium]|nr:fused MFS/spermidine synthase [Deltaproteobacteria bacterium]